MEPGNIFDSIPRNLDKEVFEQIIQDENVKIERIVSKGHSSPESGWYNQEQNEWVIILRGEAIISFENGKQLKLNEGSHFNIPAHQKHKVSCTNPNTETIWLAVHY